MATLFSYEHIGVKDEVANSISNLAPKKFPFTATIGKKKIHNQKFQWQIDFDEKEGENAWPEDVRWSEINDDYTPTTMLTSYAQKLIVGVKVTTEAEAQSYWAGGDQMNRQAEKKARKLKRDLEYAFLNNGPAVAPTTTTGPGGVGTVSTAATMAGFKALVSSDDNGATITADPLSGAITYATSVTDQPTESDILDMLAQLWSAGAEPEILMVNETMSDVISGMQAENGLRLKVFETGDKGINFEVNTITDPLGQTVKVMYNRYMPSNTVYIYNSEDWQEAVFRAPQKEDPPKDGDYKKVILTQTSGLEHRNPWASGVIVGKDAA
ncbi:Uncharacterised protein [Serratia quinivorans]|uniref:DUF5309 domain-containing protein n=1 Tax=Serratia quinivorans TaxID=137545 RepID=UPI002178023D|nr:DUF5309 domain-containing protein [Serratia quinivorans]CAI1769368.1 Uncharacterised protein [Serratia quinivorans]